MRTLKIAAAALAVCLVGACSRQASPSPTTTPTVSQTSAIETEYVPTIDGLFPIAEAGTSATPTDLISDGTYLITVNHNSSKETTTLTSVVAKNVLPERKEGSHEGASTATATSENKTPQGSAASALETPSPSSMQTRDTSLVHAGKGSRVLWSTTAKGLLECEGPTPVICYSLVQMQGQHKVDKAYIVHAETGEMEDLRLGRPGTFVVVGVHSSVAYFLTWNGTRDVHLTGFDADGAPVVDRNLRIPSEAVTGIRGQIVGNYIAVYAEKSSGIYSVATDVYAETSLTGPCLGVTDGVVCEDGNRLVGIGVSGRWTVQTTTGIISNKDGAQVDLNQALKIVEEHAGQRRSDDRDEGKNDDAHDKGIFGDISSQPSVKANEDSRLGSNKENRVENEAGLLVGDGEANENSYLTVTPQGLGIVQILPGVVTLPSGAKVALEDGARLISLDLSRSIGVALTSASPQGSSEEPNETLTSALLFSEDGTIKYKNEHDLLTRKEETIPAGRNVVVSSAKWQENTLVFYEDIDVPVVGAYRVAGA